jgi:ABC-type polysaccharide/polyol phosphate transport system ATPase subunit
MKYVLIIDEVFQVGDLGFVLKCLKTIDTIIPETVLLCLSVCPWFESSADYFNGTI